MGDEKIEQHVEVGGQAQTGNITLIGKIVNVYNVIKQPALWQDAIWTFFSKNWRWVLVWLALQTILAVVYSHFKNLYLIPLGRWAIAAAILTVVIWSASAWLRKRSAGWSGLAAIVSTVLLLAVVGWQGYQIAIPVQFEPQVFAIAVAELGEGPDYQLTDQTRLVTNQVYEHLCDAIHSDDSTPGSGSPCTSSDSTSVGGEVEVRKIGVIPSSQVAREYGAQIRADVVIWGQLFRSSGDEVTIRFQLLETFDRAVNPDFPLVLPVTIPYTEIVARETDLASDPDRVKQFIAAQAQMLSSFTLGLRAYLDRDFIEARQHFSSALGASAASPSDSVDPEVRCKEVRPESIAPGQALIYFYLGRSNNVIGRFDEGQACLQLARRAAPQEPAIPLSLAIGYNSLGQNREKETFLNEALVLLNDYLEIHPTDNAAAYDRGLAYQIRETYADAVRDYGAVLARDPDYYVAYLSLGQAASELGDYQQAEGALNDAIKLAKQSGTNPAWAHLNLARIYEKVGNPESARAQFQLAVANAPEIDAMYLYYARFLDDQKETDAALQAYQNLLDVTWDKGWGHGCLADFFKRHGLLAMALDNYQQAVHEKPDDSLTRTYLAETYAAWGESGSARLQYEQAISSTTGSYYIYASFAGFLFEAGEFDRAAKMYEESLNRHPADYAVMLNLGLTYTKLGNTRQAIAIYQQVISLTAQVPEDKVRLAQDRLNELGRSGPQ